MIQVQTRLIVADNTGARELICIRTLGSSRAIVGNVIVAVVRESLPNRTLRRSDIVRAVLVRTRFMVRRSNGSRVNFNQNAAVIINKEGNPRGCRIFGPVAQEVRDIYFVKIISLSSKIVL
jgi:large subunit ribosomal protein L14